MSFSWFVEKLALSIFSKKFGESYLVQNYFLIEKISIFHVFSTWKFYKKWGKKSIHFLLFDRVCQIRNVFSIIFFITDFFFVLLKNEHILIVCSKLIYFFVYCLSWFHCGGYQNRQMYQISGKKETARLHSIEQISRLVKPITLNPNRCEFKRWVSILLCGQVIFPLLLSNIQLWAVVN